MNEDASNNFSDGGPHVLAVAALECRLVAHRWGFEALRGDDIRRHWAARRAALPGLYDGRVLLARRVGVYGSPQASVLRLELFETAFSAFLAWREMGWPDKSVFNCFAMPAVRAADGGYLVGEMGAAHSNAGAFYFPAGTPDPSDVLPGGDVDFLGSLRRELREETGLDAARGRLSPGWTIVFDGQYVACLKEIVWPEPGAALIGGARRFLAACPNPELADVHIVPNARALDPARAPAFMGAFLDYASAGSNGSNFVEPACRLPGMMRFSPAATSESAAVSDPRAPAILAGLNGRSIVLVGMMGSGKSAIGYRLAARLGLPFIDADAEIVAAAGMSIPEIFAKYGEAYFRDGERRVIMRLLNGGQSVLATGGGAFMDARTRDRIAERGVSIWLDADLKTLLKRVRRKNDRPLLHTADPEETLRQLLEARKPAYRLADIRVESNDAPQDMMTDQTLDALAAELPTVDEARAATRKKDAAKTMNHYHPHAEAGATHREIIPVKPAGGAYDIVIGAGLLAEAGSRIAALAPGSACAIVTDENVARLHLEALKESLSGAGIRHSTTVVAPGEGSKSLSTFGSVCDAALAARIERRDLLVAFGGGVVGDLTGYVAASLRRGCRFVQIPTTLLAQVDSSVGGKTGINSTHGKNLIGAFHQPSLVLADVDILRTLPPREFRAGYAEVAKYGLIGDKRFFEWLEADCEAVFTSRAEQICAIAVSCETKAAIVARDETEQGDRALLNLGHTFGHALELLVRYDPARLVHGEGVAIGMALAARFSARLGLCAPEDADRVARHLAQVGLPTRIDQIPGWTDSADAILEAMYQDKKVEGGALTFILMRGVGEAFIARGVEPAQVLEFLRDELARK